MRIRRTDRMSGPNRATLRFTGSNSLIQMGSDRLSGRDGQFVRKIAQLWKSLLNFLFQFAE